jgi:hypothetical protein
VYQLVYPQNEAGKLYPVKFPADILLELRGNLERDLVRRFGDVLVE